MDKKLHTQEQKKTKQRKPRTLSDLVEERRKEKLDKKLLAIQPKKSEQTLKEESINYVIKDGFFTSIKSGFTESFVMPFAIALNASTGMLAALASVPQLVASFFQLFAQDSLKLFKTRGKLIFWATLMQSLMWLPLLLIPFIAKESLWLVLLIITLEATFGTFQGPIYNSILGDLINEDKRGEFFGKRNRVVNLMNFIATVVAGLILSFFKGFDKNGAVNYVFIGFAILFFIAFVARFTAAIYKKKIHTSEFNPSKKNQTSFFKFLKNMTKDNYGIFVLFICLFKFAIAISMPFFALYLLKDMQLGYFYFTIIMGASIIASFAAMMFWGKQIDKRGSKFVLTISAILIPLSPLLLILAIYIKNPLWVFIYLFIEEVFSGIAFAGFNLSTSSFLFDATSKEERINYIAYYNFLAGIAIFLGAVLGGVLIGVVPIWIVSTIPTIFLITGIVRYIVVIALLKKVRECRMVEIDFPGRGFFHKVLSIHPRCGAGIEIIGTYTKKEDSKSHHPMHEKEKRPPIDPVKPNERGLYEKKSLELYKDSAIKTMNQKNPENQKMDDSYKVEKDIENNKDKISEITQKIKKERQQK